MIKKYNEFILESNESIDSICKKYKIQNYTINEDGTVDVDGDVEMISEGLYKLPLKFRNVSGHFYCSSNQLKTLEGSPQRVGGYFNCSSNNLISLKGGPQIVGGDFNCGSNLLTTLVGGPQSVSGNFYCDENELTTLLGGPQSVSRNFICSNNQLKTLVGGPQRVGGDFYNCYNNQIKDFTGFPEFWEGAVNFGSNPVHKILNLFPQRLQSKAIYYINEFDALHDGKVLPERLEEVFHELELPISEEIYNL